MSLATKGDFKWDALTFRGYSGNLWRFVAAKSLSPRIQMRFIIIFCAGVFLVFKSDRPYGNRRRGFTQTKKIMYSLTDFEKGDVKGFLS